MWLLVAFSLSSCLCVRAPYNDTTHIEIEQAGSPFILALTTNIHFVGLECKPKGKCNISAIVYVKHTGFYFCTVFRIFVIWCIIICTICMETDISHSSKRDCFALYIAYYYYQKQHYYYYYYDHYCLLLYIFVQGFIKCIRVNNELLFISRASVSEAKPYNNWRLKWIEHRQHLGLTSNPKVHFQKQRTHQVNLMKKANTFIYLKFHTLDNTLLIRMESVIKNAKQCLLGHMCQRQNGYIQYKLPYPFYNQDLLLVYFSFLVTFQIVVNYSTVKCALFR